MATKYWVKLYNEMLHDPKVARLPDNLWRRFTECLLFASELNDNGRLPSMSDISWTLQKDEETIISEFEQLARVGLLDHATNNVLDDGYWFVTNFAKRQMPLPKAEYMRRLRTEKQKDEYYQPVTNGNAEQESDTDKEKDIDKDKEAIGDAFAFFENNFQLITVYTSEKLGNLIDEYTVQWVREAMQIAVDNNKRSLSYVEGILKRWKAQGKNVPRKEKIEVPAAEF